MSEMLSPSVGQMGLRSFDRLLARGSGRKADPVSDDVCIDY